MMGRRSKGRQKMPTWAAKALGAGALVGLIVMALGLWLDSPYDDFHEILAGGIAGTTTALAGGFVWWVHGWSKDR